MSGVAYQNPALASSKVLFDAPDVTWR